MVVWFKTRVVRFNGLVSQQGKALLDDCEEEDLKRHTTHYEHKQNSKENIQALRVESSTDWVATVDVDKS